MSGHFLVGMLSSAASTTVRGEMKVMRKWTSILLGKWKEGGENRGKMLVWEWERVWMGSDWKDGWDGDGTGWVMGEGLDKSDRWVRVRPGEGQDWIGLDWTGLG